MSRKVNDFYPTPHSIIDVMLAHWEPILTRWPYTVWEPCVGDGRLATAIGDTFNVTVYGSDINIGVDFFDSKVCVSPILITNPPFKYIRQFIDHAFTIGVEQMMLVCPERLWACKKGQEQFERHRPSVWVNLNWREDYLGKGGSPDRALAIAIWDRPHSEECKYEIWGKGK